MNPRTSHSDPIHVFWLELSATGLAGRVGTTFAPGKVGPSYAGRPWARDLGLDLDRLAGHYQTALLISMVEDHELARFQIPDLVSEAQKRGIEVLRLPTRDVHPPTLAAAQCGVAAALERAHHGHHVVIHCLGGKGRAGTLAACCAVALGLSPEEAIRVVRGGNPETIETCEQERFVSTFAESWPTQVQELR
jgi:ADP-ribosyl-[dinitrogen reductase] hydrolase